MLKVYRINILFPLTPPSPKCVWFAHSFNHWKLWMLPYHYMINPHLNQDMDLPWTTFCFLLMLWSYQALPGRSIVFEMLPSGIKPWGVSLNLNHVTSALNGLCVAPLVQSTMFLLQDGSVTGNVARHAIA